jgi:uncharacterized membrane protein
MGSSNSTNNTQDQGNQITSKANETKIIIGLVVGFVSLILLIWAYMYYKKHKSMRGSGSHFNYMYN